MFEHSLFNPPQHVKARSGPSLMALATCLLLALTIARATHAQCTYTLAFDGQLVSKAAGNYSVGVTAGVGCSWTAASNDFWITVTSGSSGSGNGTVQYSVDENTGDTRFGSITIAGNDFLVWQSASTPNCDFLSLSPNVKNNVPVGGGSFSFSVTGATPTECSWTATSNASWITTSSSATGNGTVNYTVAANGTGANRTGTITVSGYGANVIFTVKELH
ncbi:MAG TPA: BACON domain-containing carbohydrate-binding protein [Thermoanaerobaculia bacterium]|nr:BACON domain-containing carbohydrate-binding protein [Thermoanaerobaculia bacterium]